MLYEYSAIYNNRMAPSLAQKCRLLTAFRQIGSGAQFISSLCCAVLCSTTLPACAGVSPREGRNQSPGHPAAAGAAGAGLAGCGCPQAPGPTPAWDHLQRHTGTPVTMLQGVSEAGKGRGSRQPSQQQQPSCTHRVGQERMGVRTAWGTQRTQGRNRTWIFRIFNPPIPHAATTERCLG